MKSQVASLNSESDIQDIETIFWMISLLSLTGLNSESDIQDIETSLLLSLRVEWLNSESDIQDIETPW